MSLPSPQENETILLYKEILMLCKSLDIGNNPS